MAVNGEVLQLHAVYKKPYFLLQVTRESVSVQQVVCVCASILLFIAMDRVDKIRVDLSMAACAQAGILHVGSESEVDLLVHTKSRQSCARYIGAMFNGRTCKGSEGAN